MKLHLYEVSNLKFVFVFIQTTQQILVTILFIPFQIKESIQQILTFVYIHFVLTKILLEIFFEFLLFSVAQVPPLYNSICNQKYFEVIQLVLMLLGHQKHCVGFRVQLYFLAYSSTSRFRTVSKLSCKSVKPIRKQRTSLLRK